PAALRGSALLDLRFADTATAALERAVAALEHAQRLAPDDAGIQNDLAVTHLAIGERTQQLTPMLRALNAVERAAEADSLRPEILFNRALIRQRLYLVATAEQAWARYLAVERDPRWRAEAQAHARWVAQVPDTVSWDSMLTVPPARMDDANRAQIAARVAQSPQKAREFGFPLLGAWGTAVQAGDSVRAERLLAVAREIGAAARALGVDESVRLAVEAIDGAARDPARTRKLAQGHVELAAGRHSQTRNAYGDAIAALSSAAHRLHSAGSHAARWADFYHAAASLNIVDYAGGDSLLTRLLVEAGPDEPALRGRIIWALGLSQLRRGNLDSAVRRYREAVPEIKRTLESESRGGLAVLLGEGLTLSGQSLAARAEAYEALHGLAPFRQSNILANHLAIVSAYAREERLSHAALAVTDEMVLVAEKVDKPGVLALALCARVRHLIALNRHAAARKALDAATRWTEKIPRDPGGDRIRAEVALTLGQLTRVQDPAGALPQLEAAVEKYSEYGSDLYLPSALYEAALAARASGDSRRAHAWLQRAIDFIDDQRASFGTAGAGVRFSETVENVFDEMIALELDEGKWQTAFQVLERGRIYDRSATPRGSHKERRENPASLASIGESLPADMLLVEYAVLPDRLVIWTASRKGPRRLVLPIPRDSVAALTEHFSRQGSADRASASLARLHELLLRPIQGELNGIRQLTIVPDRELYRVPFAALRDGPGGHYAVEQYLIRTVPSAAFFLQAATQPRPASSHSPALVIGNPSLDPAAAGALGALPGAAREARTVADMYPGSTLLDGTHARRDRVVELLPAHSIFHFAGHAVFNPEQPELSYLALAAGGPGGGILRAGEIAELRLSNVQVVVLSACSSLNPRPSRTGAITGLAYSFLRAGAPATVSTLWDVEDGVTTELLIGFHRRMAAGTPAAEALRLAQIQALRSDDPEASDPRAWAAFIYTGP
ncbi:MAG TPA: CHAT domain-containing protein, partial [Longimicrobium sp.]|nr:CHAT domain-containing protein [Longimicrobium sp.]